MLNWSLGAKDLHNKLCHEIKLKSRTYSTFNLLQDGANVLRQKNEDLRKMHNIIEQHNITRTDEQQKTVDELKKSQRYVRLTS